MFGRQCRESKSNRWMGKLRKYMDEMGIRFDTLVHMTKLEQNRVADGWEIGRWRNDLKSMTTLQIYRNKVGLRKEDILYIEICLGHCYCSATEIIL